MATSFPRPNAPICPCDRRWKFPTKLHVMLTEADIFHFEEIVAWQDGGKSFIVRDQDRFTSEIMGRYFMQTKYKSFIRQLNMYGFRRIQQGDNKGGYAHKLFRRGKPQLCLSLAKASYLIPGQQPGIDTDSLGIDTDSLEGEPNSSEEENPGERKTALFPFKLFDLLEAAESKQFNDVVSWVNGGTAFKVHNRELFLEKIMPLYFNQTHCDSFRRQLNLYDFSRINAGEYEGAYYHELFLQNDRSLCRYINKRR